MYFRLQTQIMGVLQSGGGSRADAEKAKRLEQLLQQKESQLEAMASRLQVRVTLVLVGCRHGIPDPLVSKYARTSALPV